MSLPKTGGGAASGGRGPDPVLVLVCVTVKVPMHQSSSPKKVPVLDPGPQGAGGESRWKLCFGRFEKIFAPVNNVIIQACRDAK